MSPQLKKSFDIFARRLVRLVILSLWITWLPMASVAAQEPAFDYVPGEILIGWEAGQTGIPITARAPGVFDEDRADTAWQAAVAELTQRTALRVLDAQTHFGYARLAVPAGDEQKQIARLQGLPWVKYAEPNYLAWAADAGAFYPNDPAIGEQWHMRRVAAPQAWRITRGSLSFVVATLDTGVDFSHPDLAGRLLAGRNYVNRSSPMPEDDAPNSHGTHVAGIIAATTDNAMGVAGMAGEVRLLPLKVLNAQGSGSYSDIADALRYAADYGAQIINMSLGGAANSQVLWQAVDYAQQRGALIVAATGNCGSLSEDCSVANPDVFPAAYPGVLAVAGSDHYDRWATYSGYKPYVDLAAPGGTVYDAVWSTVRGGYGYVYGTSVATPLVAGAAALVWSLSPAATPTQIADLLKSTADKVGRHPLTGQLLPYTDGRNDYFGYGRLNVGRAVRWALPPSLHASPDSIDFFSTGGRAQRRTITLRNESDQTLWWQATIVQGGEWLSLPETSGVAWASAPGALPLVVGEMGWPAPGVHYGRVHVQPVYPTGAAPVEVQVMLHRTTPQPRAALLPLVVEDITLSPWLDPLSSTNLDSRRLYPGDDQLIAEALPFPVRFYSGVYATLHISDNGYIVLGQPPSAAGLAPIACLPTADAPNNAIYVNAANWRPALGGAIYVHRPNVNTYVITWDGMRMDGSAISQSFQLVFSSDGAIRANYRQVEAGRIGLIGTEYFDGTFADQIYCAGVGDAPRAGDRRVFKPVLPW